MEGMSVPGEAAEVRVWEQHPSETGLCCGLVPGEWRRRQPARSPSRAKLRTRPGPYTVDFHLAAVPASKLAAEPVQHGPALPPRCLQARVPGLLAPLLLCSRQDTLG